MAHEQDVVAVRMRHTIDQFPLVLELLMDHVYFLPKVYADRLLETHACDRVPDGSTPRTRRAGAGAPPPPPPPRIGDAHQAPAPAHPAGAAARRGQGRREADARD